MLIIQSNLTRVDLTPDELYIREVSDVCRCLVCLVSSVWSACRCLVTVVSVRHIAEQVGDGLAIVGSAHCLREHHADLKIRKLDLW